MLNFLKAVIGSSADIGSPRVFVVSFPRSGHHAMVGFLNKISDFADNYCEFYNCKRHNGQDIECCKSGLHWKLKKLRCGADNKIIKNHDFDLKLPYTKKDKFVVQYRHPFYSIQSWYELEKKDGKKVKPWPDFFNEKLKFWQKFITKWVIEHGDKPNVTLVPYESLSEPENVINIAEFSEVEVGDINKLGVNYFKQKRSLEDNNDFYLNHEKKIASLLKKAGIPLLFLSEH